MQRSLSGVLFLLAAIALSIAVGSWWLQRVALTPNATQGQTAAILDEPTIRGEIATVVAAATAPVVEQTPDQLAAEIDTRVLGIPAGAAVMTEIVRDAHERVLGDRDEPVRITGPQMVQIVRDERVAELQPVTLPVPRVGTLATLRSVLTWLAPISAAIGIVLLLLGLVARPEQRDVIRGLGEFGIALAVSVLFFGYVVPMHLIPAVDDNSWTNAVPQLAERRLPFVLAAAGVLAAGGVVLVIASLGTGKRKQWSTPLSVARYRDDRSWS